MAGCSVEHRRSVVNEAQQLVVGPQLLADLSHEVGTIGDAVTRLADVGDVSLEDSLRVGGHFLAEALRLEPLKILEGLVCWQGLSHGPGGHHHVGTGDGPGVGGADAQHVTRRQLHVQEHRQRPTQHPKSGGTQYQISVHRPTPQPLKLFGPFCGIFQENKKISDILLGKEGHYYFGLTRSVLISRSVTLACCQLQTIVLEQQGLMTHLFSI